MIQMLSPFLTGLQLSMGEKERERGGQSGCSPPLPTHARTQTHSDARTSSFIMSVPVRQSCVSFVGEGEGLGGMTWDT